MKPSPLQLEWVTYPKLSYEANSSYHGPDMQSMPIECEADVVYSRDGNHIAELAIKNKAATEGEAPYSFGVTVFARFKMDVDLAREFYRGDGFPTIAAVNVCRILLSSARDLLSTVTARSPYGTAMIESVMLEPRDVRVGYDDDVDLFKREVFGIAPPQAEALANKQGEPAPRDAPKKARKRAVRESKSK